MGRRKVQSETKEEKKPKDEEEIEWSDNGDESETDNDEVHPDDVTDSVLTLKAIHESVTALHSKFDALRTSQGKCVDDIQVNYNSIETMKVDNKKLRDENFSLKGELSLMKAAIMRQSREIDLLKQEALSQKAKSMSVNAIIHKIPEEKGEDCRKKVVDILKKLEYTQPCEIENAHRLGPYIAKSEFPRPVIIRLAKRSQVESLLKFGSKAENFKVTPQFPTEMREKRKQLREIAEGARKRDRQVTTKIVGDSLYVNGEKHRICFQTPKAEDLLRMTAEEKKDIFPVNYVRATETEAGSTFTVRAARAESVEKCRQLYQALMLDPVNFGANHNTAAYRLYSPKGAKTSDGYADDGEYGMGRVVRNYLQELNASNLCVFVTRHYGGVHIGPKRFTIVKALVKQVVGQLS